MPHGAEPLSAAMAMCDGAQSWKCHPLGWSLSKGTAMIYPLESAVSPDLACQVFEGPSWGLKSPAPRLYEVNQSPDGHSCPLGAGARLQTN